MASTRSPEGPMRVQHFVRLALLALAVHTPAQAQSGRDATVASVTPPAAARAGTPTFYEDVLPILQQNCQACHQPSGRNMGGMVAPFPLLTYEDARRYAGSMARAVSTGRMPPWSAAAWHKGTFENERILEEEEKQAIIAWAEGGAPAGNPAAAPLTPDFVSAVAASDGWSLGAPDLILEFAEPYCMTDDE